MAKQYILLLLLLSLCPQVQAYSPLSTSLVSSLPVWLVVHTDMSFLTAITSQPPSWLRRWLSGGNCRPCFASQKTFAVHSSCTLPSTDYRWSLQVFFQVLQVPEYRRDPLPWLLGLIVDKQTTYSHIGKEEMITKSQNGLTKKIFPAKLTSFCFIVPLLVWLFENTLNRIALKHLLNVS